MVQLTVVELRPMEERMVVVEASDMQRELAADGRVAVYGILFDFDSDRMRPDSRPQLEEIGKLLKDSPGLEVLIVGHTDSQGGYDYNVDLSKRRAASVVDALVGEHGIERARLTPVGVGMAAPVATNRSEDGRARNRRVELVER
jgi:OmpA-OmpF porin, OOP family